MRCRTSTAFLLLPLIVAVTRMHAQDTASLAPLNVVVTSEKVSVLDAVPDGKVLFVGYERSGRNYKLRLRHHRAIFVADAAGTTSLAPSEGIQPNSVWAAVDITSGRAGTAAPASATLRVAELPANAVKADNNGQLKRLVAKLPFASFVVVRPGEGAWELSAGDGGDTDADGGADGATTASLDEFRPIGEGGPPPKQYRKGDVLLVFSPEQVALFFKRLD